VNDRCITNCCKICDFIVAHRDIAAGMSLNLILLTHSFSDIRSPASEQCKTYEPTSSSGDQLKTSGSRLDNAQLAHLSNKYTLLSSCDE
jgi:hypothetical protein